MCMGLRSALLEKNLLTAAMLEACESSDSGLPQSKRLSQKIIEQKLVPDDVLKQFFAQYLHIPICDLKNLDIDLALIQLVPGNVARKHQLIPINKHGEFLTVAMADPLDDLAILELEQLCGCKVLVQAAGFAELQKKLSQHYGAYHSIQKLASELKQQAVPPIHFFDHAVFDEKSAQGPVGQLLYLILSHALEEKASDIHLEPTVAETQIRFRIDGILHPMLTLQKQTSEALVSTIKILAHLDIAEKRLPQDGSFQVRVERRMIDLRVSSFPVMNGEKMVLRVLDQSAMLLSLEQLGFEPQVFGQIQNLINQPTGMILVTGPTGSGKTTTLYSMLASVSTPTKNIMTIEDPVEYHLTGINQAQVNAKAGLTFAAGLRSFLRQDPNIILVGEIRDRETAEIAFQAALTGHLVLSTLHTNDAASAVTRLIDMGIAPFLIASAMSGVLAQRLVRKLCKHCGGAGCGHCKHTGYAGRLGIFEFLMPNAEFKAAMLSGMHSSAELKKMALQQGMVTLEQDGADKVKRGLTSEQEIKRVIQS
jgi:type IV pilus assembly protein PilB